SPKKFYLYLKLMTVIINKELNIDSKHVLYILSCLKEDHHESRLIGGCVRDALINRCNSDIDIATTLTSDLVINKLVSHGIKTIPTGVKFGTVSAFYRSEKFEITTLRKDFNYDGRYPQVMFTKSFLEDAQRRDFTINALSYCPFKKQIYDYFGGIEDLNSFKVTFIGKPVARISEDFLRIMRFFRFSCIYAKLIDSKSLTACIKLKHGLKNLSHERIRQELDKILRHKGCDSILQLMHDNNILQVITPITYFAGGVLCKANSFAKEYQIELNLLTKYALIFYSIEGLTIQQLIRIKFSRRESIIIYDMIFFLKHLNDYNYEFMLRKLWLDKENFLEYIIGAASLNKLNNNHAKEFVSRVTRHAKPIFPINGNDLLIKNVDGKKIGEILNLLKDTWIASNFQLSREQLNKRIPDFI
ncbi:MAG: CCA tRNA nucleotidyltransferase, partial [Janthinobacterium lividum]